jgi:peptidoglycan/LPS O-acetylase OafA/YrhL
MLSSRSIEWVGGMKVLRCMFPIGALLIVGSVLLDALLAHLTVNDPRTFTILVNSFLAALLLGTLLGIVGSFIERRRLPVARARRVGVVCWSASLISVVLMATIGNVHDWTFSLIFPAFVGFLAGVVLIAKRHEPAETPPNPA